MADKILVLRTCGKDMKSHGGFIYPTGGYVEAPDWDGGKDCCGGGLHGFKWGVGDGQLANWDADAKWLVIAVDHDVLIDVTQYGGGKCKFKGGDVVFCGDRKGATDYLAANGAADKPIVGGTATAGEGGTATAGYRGTATAGDGGLLVLKYWDVTGVRNRIATAYVGEDGIEANTPYRYDVALKQFTKVIGEES